MIAVSRYQTLNVEIKPQKENIVLLDTHYLVQLVHNCYSTYSGGQKSVCSTKKVIEISVWTKHFKDVQ